MKYLGKSLMSSRREELQVGLKATYTEKPLSIQTKEKNDKGEEVRSAHHNLYLARDVYASMQKMKCFLRSPNENAVHNLGCPVLSRLTLFDIFSSTFCIFLGHFD